MEYKAIILHDAETNSPIGINIANIGAFEYITTTINGKETKKTAIRFIRPINVDNEEYKGILVNETVENIQKIFNS